MSRRFTRRDMLRRSAALGAVAAVPANVLAQAASAAPYANLTAAEAATLEAIVARLIPSDAQRPGALEAGAARYIDGALGDALAAQRARLRGRARGARGLLTRARGRLVRGAAGRATGRAAHAISSRTGRPGSRRRRARSSISCWAHARGHVRRSALRRQSDFIGWELIGYPGLRLAVTAEQQRMDAALEPIESSAYDHAQFDEHATAGERDDD